MFHPSIPNYPKAQFPGVVVFSEIYQGENLHLFLPMISSSSYLRAPLLTTNIADLHVFKVTGPVARFARQIAGCGYIVAAPSSYHEFTGPEPLAYDGPGTDAGNKWKAEKQVAAFDEDAKLSVDHLIGLDTCNGRIGATGACCPCHG